jgi:DNA repair exonuclease SbcCD nuclease subunit
MRALIVGDTHGNARWFYNVVLRAAVERNVQKIVQVGDFGYIWPETNYEFTLDKMNRLLCDAEIDLHFLPGNHDDFDALERMTAEESSRSPEGHVPLRDRVFYTGKVSAWEWGGQRLAAVGGATSIDRRWRVAGKSWWPQEALTDAEQAAAEALGHVQVLLSHDAPSHNPFSLEPDADSAVHRRRMTEIGRALRPLVWFHGHYHRSVEYTFNHDEGVARVVSLDMDGTTLDGNTSLLRLAPPG